MQRFLKIFILPIYDKINDSIMRRILSVLLVFMSIHIANAQFAENHAIYLSGEVGGGNHTGKSTCWCGIHNN